MAWRHIASFLFLLPSHLSLFDRLWHHLISFTFFPNNENERDSNGDSKMKENKHCRLTAEQISYPSLFEHILVEELTFRCIHIEKGKDHSRLDVRNLHRRRLNENDWKSCLHLGSRGWGIVYRSKFQTWNSVSREYQIIQRVERFLSCFFYTIWLPVDEPWSVF